MSVVDKQFEEEQGRTSRSLQKPQQTRQRWNNPKIDDEMLRLEVKIEEDEKFIKFLKELVGE